MVPGCVSASLFIYISGRLTHSVSVMPDDQFKGHCLLSPDVRPLIKACPSKSQHTNFHRASQERARIIAERCGGRGGGDVERPGLPERGDRQSAEAHQVGEDLVEGNHRRGIRGLRHRKIVFFSFHFVACMSFARGQPGATVPRGSSPLPSSLGALVVKAQAVVSSSLERFLQVLWRTIPDCFAHVRRRGTRHKCIGRSQAFLGVRDGLQQRKLVLLLCLFAEHHEEARRVRSL